jgi:hypothetical protein
VVDGLEDGVVDGLEDGVIGGLELGERAPARSSGVASPAKTTGRSTKSRRPVSTAAATAAIHLGDDGRFGRGRSAGSDVVTDSIVGNLASSGSHLVGWGPASGGIATVAGL